MLFMRTTEQFRIAYTAKTEERSGPILAHAVRSAIFIPKVNVRINVHTERTILAMESSIHENMPIPIYPTPSYQTHTC